MTRPNTLNDPIQQLVTRKGKEYGTAWLLTSKMVRHIPDEQLLLLARSGLFYAWVVILGKLCRLLFNPYHLDSWVDIQAYARLVEDFLRPAKKGGTGSSVTENQSKRR